MNIKKAKQEIKNTLTAYFTKDEYGNYIIPIEKQRPVFLMGPPGIGKTAIMEQVGEELEVPVISYSMTHHTRQSALGLPFITQRNYGGTEFQISEYTMSEIIASVYDVIEKSGKKEGILFLDEINCVSETLAPIMLQFLQYKIFGKHKVPDGFIVVTAGNPPEFNNSVREFDIVTWDRLKRIDVEADFSVWREYAANNGTHSSVISYLDIKKDEFYSITTSVDGKQFVTARGWEDLSQMIHLYERHEMNIDLDVISQYLQNRKIAKNFANYYTLYVKYRKEYNIESILEGKVSAGIKDNAKKAGFDERLSVVSLITSAITSRINNVMDLNLINDAALRDLKIFKVRYAFDNFRGYIEDKQNEITKKENAGIYTQKQRFIDNSIFKILDTFKDAKDMDQFFDNNKKIIDNLVKENQENVKNVLKNLENAFKFIESSFKSGQEMLIFVTELTANLNSSKFIGLYGCDEYFKHNKDLMLTRRTNEINDEINKLNL